MELSPPHHPTTTTATTSSSSSNGSHYKSPLPSPTTVTRSDPSNPYPTTFVQADTSSFKQVVQMLTGSSDPPPKKSNPIPPIKPTNKSKLYERRNNSLKHLRINHSPQLYNHNNNDIFSPSMLDFPGLVLSPVTPLIHDPFIRSPVSSNCSPQLNGVVCVDKVAEEKAIAEKGFYLHPVSPASEPRLLTLFPLTSPKADHLHQQHSKQNYNNNT